MARPTTRPARAAAVVGPLALPAALVATVLPVPTAAAAPETRTPVRAAQIIGTWSGDVVVDEGLSEGYTARVVIRRNAAGKLRGRIAYDVTEETEGTDCSGRWRFKGKRAGAFTFKEVITIDPLDEVSCPTPVAVRVVPTDEGIDVEWRVVKSGEVATMSATAVSGSRRS